MPSDCTDGFTFTTCLQMRARRELVACGKRSSIPAATKHARLVHCFTNSWIPSTRSKITSLVWTVAKRIMMRGHLQVDSAEMCCLYVVATYFWPRNTECSRPHPRYRGSDHFCGTAPHPLLNIDSHRRRLSFASTSGHVAYLARHGLTFCIAFRLLASVYFKWRS